jgi:hypothetical protein
VAIAQPGRSTPALLALRAAPLPAGDGVWQLTPAPLPAVPAHQCTDARSLHDAEELLTLCQQPCASSVGADQGSWLLLTRQSDMLRLRALQPHRGLVAAPLLELQHDLLRTLTADHFLLGPGPFLVLQSESHGCLELLLMFPCCPAAGGGGGGSPSWQQLELQLPAHELLHRVCSAAGKQPPPPAVQVAQMGSVRLLQATCSSSSSGDGATAQLLITLDGAASKPSKVKQGQISTTGGAGSSRSSSSSSSNSTSLLLWMQAMLPGRSTLHMQQEEQLELLGWHDLGWHTGVQCTCASSIAAASKATQQGWQQIAVGSSAGDVQLLQLPPPSPQQLSSRPCTPWQALRIAVGHVEGVVRRIEQLPHVWLAGMQQQDVLAALHCPQLDSGAAAPVGTVTLLTQRGSALLQLAAVHGAAALLVPASPMLGLLCEQQQQQQAVCEQGALLQLGALVLLDPTATTGGGGSMLAHPNCQGLDGCYAWLPPVPAAGGCALLGLLKRGPGSAACDEQPQQQFPVQRAESGALLGLCGHQTVNGDWLTSGAQEQQGKAGAECAGEQQGLQSMLEALQQRWQQGVL